MCIHQIQQFVQPHLGFSLPQLTSATTVLSAEQKRMLLYLVCPLLTPLFHQIRFSNTCKMQFCQLVCLVIWDVFVIVSSVVQYKQDMKVCLRNSNFLPPLSHSLSLAHTNVKWPTKTFIDLTQHLKFKKKKNLKTAKIDIYSYRKHSGGTIE